MSIYDRVHDEMEQGWGQRRHFGVVHRKDRVVGGPDLTRSA